MRNALLRRALPGTAAILSLLALAACGGVFSASNPASDANTGNFDAAAGSPVVTTRARHTATLLENGDALIAGGVTSTGQPTTSAEIYHPLAQQFAATGALVTARQRHTATRLDDGSVAVIGGEDGGGPLATAEIWDPGLGGNGGFRAIAGPMTQARRNHTATRIPDGTVLVAGGDDGTNVLDSIERFDGTGFQTVGHLLQARTRATAIRKRNGDVIVFGGFTDAGQTTATNTVEVIDHTTYVARSAGRLNVPRAGAVAIVLPDGRVMIPGGFSDSTTARDDAEIYDPDGERSNGAPRLTRVRGTARAATLFDGRVLVVGDDASADLWNPQDSTFVAAASALNGARTGGHSLTPTGATVLVLGGTATVTATAEVFDPR